MMYDGILYITYDIYVLSIYLFVYTFDLSEGFILHIPSGIIFTRLFLMFFFFLFEI